MRSNIRVDEAAPLVKAFVDPLQGFTQTSVLEEPIAQGFFPIPVSRHRSDKTARKLSRPD
jgi:hypothetical protein